jgi:ubiquinone/menaquinone biosynthesis C-methylase UbiE
MDFYNKIIKRLVSESRLDPDASTLVIAGGPADVDVLRANGFARVTISNVDTRFRGDEFAPYEWSFQDAENLTFKDASFAQVIVHAGLHHCGSPHKALVEMYRVAQKSVVAFEARDSTLMRTALRLGFGTEHEVEAVVGHGYEFGGLRNGPIPNFVYRWTEREVAKTLASFDPRGPIPIRFFYGLRLPTLRRDFLKSGFKRMMLAASFVPTRIIFAIARRQGNEFAFWIGKPSAMHPWLTTEGKPNRAWIDERYARPQLSV